MSMETTDTPPSPNGRVRVIAGVGAGATIVLIALYFLFVRQEYAVLYSGMRPEDAAIAVEALEKENISYRLAAGGSEIRVRADQLDAARIDLAGSGAAMGASEGFELFNESDMGLTDFSQKIRYQRALQGELTRTIMAMEGVADARVHITMPERTLFRSERRSARAAVTLTMRTAGEETQQRIEGIQRLVAASVPDLAVSDVVILNASGEIISPTVAISPPVGAGAAIAEASPPIEAILAIVREALPAHRFEVRLDPVTPDLAGGEGDSLDAPSTVLTVTTARRLGDVEMERVSMALRAAHIVDGDANTSLQFRIAPPSHIEARDTVAASTEPTQSSPRPALDWAAAMPWIGLGALFLLAVGFLAWLTQVSRPTLAPEEQEKFAAHLRSLLDAEPAGSERG